ncbi:hypothetical protein RA28_13920 [Ruegeria sp. ANG-S4]|uniref:hypothetical protein n=1 Tax=Ruegeria sp. ANG-S4 TaxID=1577904 RepID=UPI00057F5CC7|nr:hypothetical protein [Ruegeria sp. ANG-S4]KIC44081.1 hypothetical protein RA28_13920 [Ruegeria sp. ANG-S4]
MAKTLKDLLLALLNATLILLALCLFLGWKLAQSVQDIREGFAENLQVVAPLREEAQGIRGELAGLRSDLTSIRDQGIAISPTTQAKLDTALDRLNEIETRLSETQTRLAGLVENPEELIDYAVTTAAEAAAEKVQAVRGCTPSA